MPNVIILRGDPRIKSKVAAEALTPGKLLEDDGSGGIQEHDTAGGNCKPWVALTNPATNPSSTALIDVDNASGDNTNFAMGRPGEEFYMWLKDGENVSEGDLLESDGAGNLQAHTPQAVDEGGTATYSVLANAARFEAAEDKDSSAGTVAVRIRARVV